VVRWTADHGGPFVLTSGLTLADQERAFFFRILRDRLSELVERYERLYPSRLVQRSAAGDEAHGAGQPREDGGERG
jgi:hypothetical protein